jgi:hypothetical protein
MKVKGKRVLKNGSIAGYVYYKGENKWKWRIIKGPLKGGVKSIDMKINEIELFPPNIGNFKLPRPTGNMKISNNVMNINEYNESKKFNLEFGRDIVDQNRWDKAIIENIERKQNNYDMNIYDNDILRGPVNLFYYNDLIGKNILLLGDLHLNLNRDERVKTIDIDKLIDNNNNIKDIHLFIADILEKSDKCIDFFVEDYVSQNEKYLSHNNGASSSVNSTFRNRNQNQQVSDPQRLGQEEVNEIKLSNGDIYVNKRNKKIKIIHVEGNNVVYDPDFEQGGSSKDELVMSINNLYRNYELLKSPLKGGFVNITKIGRRKIRYYKNGNPYVIIKGKQVSYSQKGGNGIRDIINGELYNKLIDTLKKQFNIISLGKSEITERDICLYIYFMKRIKDVHLDDGNDVEQRIINTVVKRVMGYYSRHGGSYDEILEYVKSKCNDMRSDNEHKFMMNNFLNTNVDTYIKKSLNSINEYIEKSKVNVNGVLEIISHFDKRTKELMIYQKILNMILEKEKEQKNMKQLIKNEGLGKFKNPLLAIRAKFFDCSRHHKMECIYPNLRYHNLDLRYMLYSINNEEITNSNKQSLNKLLINNPNFNLYDINPKSDFNIEKNNIRYGAIVPVAMLLMPDMYKKLYTVYRKISKILKKKIDYNDFKKIMVKCIIGLEENKEIESEFDTFYKSGNKLWFDNKQLKKFQYNKHINIRKEKIKKILNKIPEERKKKFIKIFLNVYSHSIQDILMLFPLTDFYLICRLLVEYKPNKMNRVKEPCRSVLTPTNIIIYMGAFHIILLNEFFKQFGESGPKYTTMTPYNQMINLKTDIYQNLDGGLAQEPITFDKLMKDYL